MCIEMQDFKLITTVAWRTVHRRCQTKDDNTQRKIHYIDSLAFMSNEPTSGLTANWREFLKIYLSRQRKGYLSTYPWRLPALAGPLPPVHHSVDSRPPGWSRPGFSCFSVEASQITARKTIWKFKKRKYFHLDLSSFRIWQINLNNAWITAKTLVKCVGIKSPSSLQ